MDEAEKFRAALEYFIDCDEHGTGSDLARGIDVGANYVSMIKNGHRNASEWTRRKIAAFYGYDYENFLEIGKVLISNGKIEKSELAAKKSVDIGKPSVVTSVKFSEITIFEKTLNINGGIPMGEVARKELVSEGDKCFGIRVDDEREVIVNPEKRLVHGCHCWDDETKEVYRYYEYGSFFVLRRRDHSELKRKSKKGLYKITRIVQIVG